MGNPMYSANSRLKHNMKSVQDSEQQVDMKPKDHEFYSLGIIM